MMMYEDCVCVRSSEDLTCAVAGVLASAGGWESSSGWQVARAVELEAARRWRSARFSTCDVVDAVELVVLANSEELLDWAEAHQGQDVWGWVFARALCQLRREWLLEALGGLTGDKNLHRLASRIGLRPVVSLDSLASADVLSLSPVVRDDSDNCDRVVPSDLGPVLRPIAELLEAIGVEREVAWAGTCRILELAAVGEKDRRHTRARKDAAEGHLGSLGISPRAAGAWMSIVTGSRRLGQEVLLHLRWLRGGNLPAHKKRGLWMFCLILLVLFAWLWLLDRFLAK